MPGGAIFIRVLCVSPLNATHSDEIPSKLAEFWKLTCPSGNGVQCARVVHNPVIKERGPDVEAQRMMEEMKSTVVLIVEDDREMRSLLRDELYDLGVTIQEASDGDEALRLVLNSRPSLILTDLRMPAGGLDYISRLRTFAPGVPMVLITSFGGPQTKAEALAIGVEAYFDKPVRLSELRGAIRRLLGPSLSGKAH